MQLTPITSELVGGVINKEKIGDKQEMSIGLPVINMREMSTSAEVVLQDDGNPDQGPRLLPLRQALVRPVRHLAAGFDRRRLSIQSHLYP